MTKSKCVFCSPKKELSPLDNISGREEMWRQHQYHDANQKVEPEKKECKCGGGGIYNVHLETCNEVSKCCWTCRSERGCLGLPNTSGESACPCHQPKDTMEDCQKCGFYICKCEVKPFEPKDHIVQDWREELEELEFPTYTDYGCDGMSDECCGSCGGETIDESKTKEKLTIFIEKVVDQQVSKALDEQKEIIIKEVSLIINHALCTHQNKTYILALRDVITKIKQLDEKPK